MASEIQLLRDKGYRGAISLELFNPLLWEQDPGAVLARGIERMRQLLG